MVIEEFGPDGFGYHYTPLCIEPRSCGSAGRERSEEKKQERCKRKSLVREYPSQGVKECSTHQKSNWEMDQEWVNVLQVLHPWENDSYHRYSTFSTVRN